MEEKKALQTTNHRKKYTSFTGKAIHVVITLILLSLLAWFVLLLWFLCLWYLHGSGSVINILSGTASIIISRLLLFTKNLPLLLCLLFVMLVDGLGQRDIRKFQGSRESTFFFHRIKPLTGTVFYGFFLVYMCMPFSLSPQITLVPMALLFSIMTMLTVKHYKKYA